MADQDWFGEEKVLDMKEMDGLIEKMRDLRLKYEDKKRESTDAYNEYKEVELEVMKALEAAGKASYKVDGLGTFSVVEKMTVTTPKTNEEKEQVFGWIGQNYGPEYLTSMLSINHQKLNSFYKEAFAASENQAMFSIPGLQEPTTIKEGRFRSSK